MHSFIKLFRVYDQLGHDEVINSFKSQISTFQFCSLESKFRRITGPRFATRKKLGIRLLFGYKYWAESGVITGLEVYERWYSSEFEPGWYLCFDWTRFWVFNIELRLDLGYRLLRLGLENESQVSTPIPWVKICFVIFYFRFSSVSSGCVNGAVDEKLLSHCRPKFWFFSQFPSSYLRSRVALLSGVTQMWQDQRREA